MVLLNAEKKKNENTRQYIYRVLKENIMNLNLAPGEMIGEIELGKVLNVSRTPVREAIVKLSEEKLLNVFPQKGSFVSRINLTLVEEAIFLREMCEEKLLEMACRDEHKEDLIEKLEKNIEFQKVVINFKENLHEFFILDNEFHSLIFDHYNKKNIWKSIKRLSTHYDRLRLLDALEKTNLEKTLKQHIEILNIIREGDSKSIDMLLTKHLLNFKDVIEKFMMKYPTYFCEK
ncbi:GntR family transcriptional regulator [uncultured Cetobacterium sp.]|uniref:GntR family transcriptional regulator n=1 Tax=uncultured Cetobacterium sp. TaxID=527638 RepID=UPI0026178516|nr:GntR family transcriptional regulator [uncultured Cetobacterium sp.]